MTNSVSTSEPSENTLASARLPNPWLARFALLFGLLALAGAGYLSFRLIYLQPFAVQTQQTQKSIDALEQKLLSEMDALIAESRRGVADLALELAAENREVQQTLEKAVAQTLKEAKANKPTTPRQWRLAEAAFLLRMANYSLQFEGDVGSAIRALQQADVAVLAVQGQGDQDKYDLLPVRSAIAQELLLLKQMQPIDVQGIYLRLQALAENVPAVKDGLSLNPDKSSVMPPSESSYVAVVANELGKFFRITDLSTIDDQNVDQGVDQGVDQWRAKNTGPDQILAARRNVVAALERAQVAALRRQDDIYQSNLTDAMRAAQRLGPPSDGQLLQYQRQLAEIAEQPLNAPVPKISGSLGALSQLMDSL